MKLSLLERKGESIPSWEDWVVLASGCRRKPLILVYNYMLRNFLLFYEFKFINQFFYSMF